MIIRRTVQQFFKVHPEYFRVPPVSSRPGRKQLIASRPPLTPEGVELHLLALPSKRQLRVQLLSKLIFFDLSEEENSIIIPLLSIFSLHPDLDTIMENILFRDFSSKFIPEKERVKFSEALENEGFLSFQPTKLLSRMKTELLVVRRWKGRSRVVRPQRKRGYDDKGNLAPPDSINWREVALSNSDVPLNIFGTDADSISPPDRSDLRDQSRLTMATRVEFQLKAETFVHEFLSRRKM